MCEKGKNVNCFKGEDLKEVVHEIYFGDTEYILSCHSYYAKLLNELFNSDKTFPMLTIQKGLSMFRKNMLLHFGESYLLFDYKKSNVEDLNTFVKKVSVSITNCGVAMYDDNNAPKSYNSIITKTVEPSYIPYYTDIYGINHCIEDSSLSSTIIKNADLLVTSMGILIFSLPHKVYASLDMRSCIEIDIPKMSNNDKITKVCALQDGRIYIETLSNFGEKNIFFVNFYINLSSSNQPIKYLVYTDYYEESSTNS